MSITTNYIDYAQRTGSKFDLKDHATPYFHFVKGILRILGRGTYFKNNHDVKISSTFTSGLHAISKNVMFCIKGVGGQTSFYLDVEAHQSLVPDLMHGDYQSIEYQALETHQIHQINNNLKTFDRVGIAIGVPGLSNAEAKISDLPIDTIIQILGSSNWMLLVAAQPIPSSKTKILLFQTINEIRRTLLTKEQESLPNHLADYYLEILKNSFNRMTLGLDTGLWRTAIYLFGNEASYQKLKSATVGVFKNGNENEEPFKIYDFEKSINTNSNILANFTMPDVIYPPAGEVGGSCHYEHPYKYQTLLTSNLLAQYMHLPSREINGFYVRQIPNFDLVRTTGSTTQDNISIGQIRIGSDFINQTQSTISEIKKEGEDISSSYLIETSALTRHSLIAGVTGAGKTNTIFNILKQLSSTSGQSTPFLIIEPTKTEYRELLESRKDIHIFTLGDETLAPFRLNPFEPSSGASISTHIGLLRSVFAVSFGMWTPLPQILERCLHEIYEDKGWNLLNNTNYRVADDSHIPNDVFPTLSDLYDKVEEVVNNLGYHDEFTMAARAALRTRIKSLMAGGKGVMLDTNRSFPMVELLNHSTILELEAMGDDDDKAFVMGILFIALIEYRRKVGFQKDLQHLLVIEEAHRLFLDLPQRQHEFEADSRGKAVESIANLLAEVRAYGQGIILADQIPTKLASDAIKNTNLKIIHRLVSADDRKIIAGATAMNEAQTDSLGVFPIGYAAVFAEGDDAPILVRVPPVKQDDSNPIGQGVISQRHEEHLNIVKFKLSTYVTCPKNCVPQNKHCQNLGSIRNVEYERQFAALVLSFALIESNAPQQQQDYFQIYQKIVFVLLPLLPEKFRRLDPRGENENAATQWEITHIKCLLSHSVYRYLNKRGAQYGWTYTDVAEMADLLIQGIYKLTEIYFEGYKFSNYNFTVLRDFATKYRDLSRRTGPFYGCEKACNGTCYHRYAVSNIDDLYPVAKLKDFAHALQEKSKPTQEASKPKIELELLEKYVANQISFPEVPQKFKQQATLCTIIQKRTQLEHTVQQQLDIVDEAFRSLSNR